MLFDIEDEFLAGTRNYFTRLEIQNFQFEIEKERR